jgi:peptide/nickel transport system substrate-binding protein
VTFHNGEPLTAEDVAFSIGPERVWGEDALVPIGQRYTESIVGVEAIDDTTVEVRTDVEDPNLPYRFITLSATSSPKITTLRSARTSSVRTPSAPVPTR